MKNIKFSDDYVKLHGQETAELVCVKEIIINKETSQEFIDYDTTKTDGSKYELKNGKYLQLIFVGDKGIPFCTCRSAYPQQKIEYYKNSLGEIFKILRGLQ